MSDLKDVDIELLKKQVDNPDEPDNPDTPNYDDGYLYINGVRLEKNKTTEELLIGYPELLNKPSINGVELLGNKTNEELGIPTKTSELENDSDYVTQEYISTTRPQINGVELNGNKSTQDLNISYNDISNRPSINGITLSGDQTSEDLGIVGNTDYNHLSNHPSINGVTLTGDKSSSDLGIVTEADVVNKLSTIGITSTTYAGKATTASKADEASKLSTAHTIGISGGVTGTPTAFDGTKDISINVTKVDASFIDGTISVDHLPKAALDKIITVSTDADRYKLTTSTVHNGDTVRVAATGLLYLVRDENNLSNSTGYTEYTAGQASSVPWSGITDKPSTFTPSAHIHQISEINGLQNQLNARAYVPDVLEGTLKAGSTSITLSDEDVELDDDSIITVYTNKYGVQPTNVIVSGNNVTLTFNSQSTDMKVKVEVTE